MADAWKLQFPGSTESSNLRDYQSSDRESAAGASSAWAAVRSHSHIGIRCPSRSNERRAEWFGMQWGSREVWGRYWNTGKAAMLGGILATQSGDVPALLLSCGRRCTLFCSCDVLSALKGSGQVCPKLDQGKPHPPCAFAVARPCQLLGEKKWRIEQTSDLLGLISR